MVNTNSDAARSDALVLFGVTGDHRCYIRQYGEDMSEIREWK